ncbi:HesA/MoeB/ThiF family protein [Lacicoccus alkaliphilus]|uniref:Adenylyltransferase and sulfurtransferase n=1 Tax=Lacicoccus alkaliphilus DSM 16010 TaxID=1123231 RepID=A0A1M7ITT6_9BACL|nr:ThiF family adenylyltransferase [Salinicoccus alkaliphilus]SHM44109.1 adenylyltransferase and sulfurtransferase [Salinicoccus alkaliphilus DSM 16010]
MDRYDRQIRFQGFSESGQENLSRATVMVMGAGALGTHVSELLTRMGAGKLITIDMDIVEMTNLHRQTLYTEEDVRLMKPKVEALKEELGQINSDVVIKTLNTELASNNIIGILKEHQPDIVIDAMDHFEIRFLINEACHKLGIPWVYGAAVGSKGSVYAIDFDGPCLKCLMDTMPASGESCEINGVLPPVITQTAGIEVSEAIRFLSGAGFSKKLITIDTFGMNYKTMNIDALKNDDCTVCGQHNYEHLEKETFRPVQSNCGRVFTLRFDDEIFEEELQGKIIKENRFVKFINYDGYDMTLFNDGRMNVYGLEGQEEAETLYLEIAGSLSANFHK